MAIQGVAPVHLRRCEIVLGGRSANNRTEWNEIHEKQEAEDGTSVILALARNYVRALDDNGRIEQIDKPFRLGLGLCILVNCQLVCVRYLLGWRPLRPRLITLIRWCNLKTAIVRTSWLRCRVLLFRLLHHEYDEINAHQVQRQANKQ